VGILSRYFVARFLGLFAAILVGSLITIVIVETLLNLDDMLRDQDGTLGALRYLAIRIPTLYLRPIVPIASFAAAFFSLGLAAHWLELTALEAGGISPRRIVLPLLGAAALLGLAGFVATEGWALDAANRLNRPESDADEVLAYRRGSFWYHKGDTIYNISEANRDERTLRGVSVYQLTPRGRLRRSIRASHVEIGHAGVWTFHEATISRFRPGDAEATPSIQQLDEVALAMNAGGETLMHADAKSLSLPLLLEYIDVREGRGMPTQPQRALLHARLTEPLLVGLFALLALPLGLQVGRRRGFGLSAAVGIAVVASFFFLRDVGQTLASQGVVPAALPAWALIGVFALAGAWQFEKSLRP